MSFDFPAYHVECVSIAREVDCAIYNVRCMNVNDPETPCCDSPEEPRRAVCLHFFNDWIVNREKGKLPFHFRFQGRNPIYELVCEDCGAARSPATHSLCHDCFDTITLGTRRRREDIGPDVVEKSVGLQAEIRPLGINVSLQAVSPSNESDFWFAITMDWRVIQFRSDDAVFNEIVSLKDVLPADGPLGILANRNGRLLVVFEEFNSKAVVVDASSGSVTMMLDRGNYHTEQCRYPVAFFERNGRSLLVHATDWNRLDISDPYTGELLTPRVSPRYEDKKRPAHYLDYFHAGLAISPDAHWITSNGWVWAPWGGVRCWDLARWLNENVWESEDGPSVTTLCDAGYYWNRPLCWIDDHTVAWWGIGNDDEIMVPAIVVHDMNGGEDKVIVPGPLKGPTKHMVSYQLDGSPRKVYQTTGRMLFDQWLFAWRAEGEFSAWDLSDGSRVYHRTDISPQAYHYGRREFLCRADDGWSVLRFTTGFE